MIDGPEESLTNSEIYRKVSDLYKLHLRKQSKRVINAQSKLFSHLKDKPVSLGFEVLKSAKYQAQAEYGISIVKNNSPKKNSAALLRKAATEGNKNPKTYVKNFNSEAYKSKPSWNNRVTSAEDEEKEKLRQNFGIINEISNLNAILSPQPPQSNKPSSIRPSSADPNTHSTRPSSANAINRRTYNGKEFNVEPGKIRPQKKRKSKKRPKSADCTNKNNKRTIISDLVVGEGGFNDENNDNNNTQSQILWFTPSKEGIDIDIFNKVESPDQELNHKLIGTINSTKDDTNFIKLTDKEKMKNVINKFFDKNQQFKSNEIESQNEDNYSEDFNNDNDDIITDNFNNSTEREVYMTTQITTSISTPTSPNEDTVNNNVQNNTPNQTTLSILCELEKNISPTTSKLLSLQSMTPGHLKVMSPSDIYDLLNKLGFENYTESLLQLGVNGEDLLNSEEEDLIHCGLVFRPHRLRLLRFIIGVKNNNLNNNNSNDDHSYITEPSRKTSRGGYHLRKSRTPIKNNSPIDHYDNNKSIDKDDEDLMGNHTLTPIAFDKSLVNKVTISNSTYISPDKTTPMTTPYTNKSTNNSTNNHKNHLNMSALRIQLAWRTSIAIKEISILRNKKTIYRRGLRRKKEERRKIQLQTHSVIKIQTFWRMILSFRILKDKKIENRRKKHDMKEKSRKIKLRKQQIQFASLIQKYWRNYKVRKFYLSNVKKGVIKNLQNPFISTKQNEYIEKLRQELEQQIQLNIIEKKQNIQQQEIIKNEILEQILKEKKITEDKLIQQKLEIEHEKKLQYEQTQKIIKDQLLLEQQIKQQHEQLLNQKKLELKLLEQIKYKSEEDDKKEQIKQSQLFQLNKQKEFVSAMKIQEFLKTIISKIKAKRIRIQIINDKFKSYKENISAIKIQTMYRGWVIRADDIISYYRQCKIDKEEIKRIEDEEDERILAEEERIRKEDELREEEEEILEERERERLENINKANQENNNNEIIIEKEKVEIKQRARTKQIFLLRIEEEKKQIDAIILIQSIYRRHQAREDFLFRKDEYEWHLKRVEEKRINEWNSFFALKIQTRWRIIIAKAKIIQMKELKEYYRLASIKYWRVNILTKEGAYDAAVKIQTCWRCLLARIILKVKEEETRQHGVQWNEWLSAIKIQSMWRTTLVLMKINLHKKFIRKYARSHDEWNYYAYRLQHCIKGLIIKVKRKENRRLSTKIIKIQTLWRKYYAIIFTIRFRIETKAAIIIQSFLRMWISKFNYSLYKYNQIKWAKDDLKLKSAIKIQASIRRFTAYKIIDIRKAVRETAILLFKEENVIKIQSRWRLYIAIKKVKYMREYNYQVKNGDLLSPIRVKNSNNFNLMFDAFGSYSTINTPLQSPHHARGDDDNTDMMVDAFGSPAYSPSSPMGTLVSPKASRKYNSNIIQPEITSYSPSMNNTTHSLLLNNVLTPRKDIVISPVVDDDIITVTEESPHFKPGFPEKFQRKVSKKSNKLKRVNSYEQNKSITPSSSSQNDFLNSSQNNLSQTSNSSSNSLLYYSNSSKDVLNQSNDNLSKDILNYSNNSSQKSIEVNEINDSFQDLAVGIAQNSPSKAPVKNTDWIEINDGKSTFYFNSVTKECAMSPPKKKKTKPKPKTLLNSPLFGGPVGSSTGEDWKLKRKSSAQLIIVDEWQMHMDFESNCPFYYNIRTQESTWEIPSHLNEADKQKLSIKAGWNSVMDRSKETVTKNSTSENEWTIFYDPISKHHFYHNKVTEETTWELPEEFIIGAYKIDISGNNNNESDNTFTRITSLLNVKSTNSDWNAYIDKGERAIFYSNHTTGECTWTPPDQPIVESNDDENDYNDEAYVVNDDFSELGF